MSTENAPSGIIQLLQQAATQAVAWLRARLGLQGAPPGPENGGGDGLTGEAILEALSEELSEIADALTEFLNSDWAFGLTLAGARRRRWLFTLLGAVAWASLGYRGVQPGWDVADGVAFLRSISRALFDPRLLLLVFFLATLFWLLLYAVNRLLAGSTLGAMRRYSSAILATFAGALWGLLASQLIPTDLPFDFARQFIAYPFEALFAPGVLRHVLVAAMAFWITYRVAATYLEDIYELDDIRTAERFILQAAFASQYNVIQIRVGDVIQEHKRSPIFRIGGPGLVQVHYDSVTLFESVAGTPRVIGPTTNGVANVETLSGFERLRQSLKLYDHIEEKFPIEGRTRDGLRIRLKDVNIVYSIYRDGREPTMSHPYPFDPQAVLNLVYNQGPNPLEPAMRSVIRREFVSFISKHTMNEFLASIGSRDVEEHQEQEAELAQSSTQFSGLLASGESLLSAPELPFHTRPDIMTELFAEEFAARAAERGVEIRWIGGGAWDPVDSIVLDKHQEAWRLSRQNLVRGNTLALGRLRLEHSLFEKLRLIQEVPIRIYTESRNAPARDLMLKVMVAYRQILNQAYEAHQRDPSNPAQLVWLQQVLAYLSYFTARWLGGA
ncbi:MAG TPA: hypothetical protein VJL34_03635 [Anaerolineales bacterium]|nr:hypothetical protein [Anaerolineales bacterium]